MTEPTAAIGAVSDPVLEIVRRFRPGERRILQVIQEPEAAGIPLPAYQTEGAAGLDLRAAIPAAESFWLLPGKRALIPTGLRFAVPPGFEVQVRPRSGLALSRGLIVVNSPGTIDSDYRGLVGVILHNLGENSLAIRRGDRIAQMVLCPVARVVWQVVTALPESDRGEGGCGSTGQE